MTLNTEISATNDDVPLDEDCVLITAPMWIFRNGLKHLVLEHTEYKHILEVESLDEMRNVLAKWSQIKFLILDLHLPDMSPVETFERIRDLIGDLPVLVMSNGYTRDEILRTINLGAAGIIATNCDQEEMLNAIHAIERGEIRISKSLFETADALEHDGPPKLDAEQSRAVKSLTRRQHEVLIELGRGQSNRAIAEKLNVSEHTIKIHVAAVLKTLRVTNRTQAALLAQGQ